MLAPDASLQDGLLDVVMIEDMPRLRYLGLAPTVFFGRHVRHRAVRVVRTRELHISATRPFTLFADGDPIAELPGHGARAAGRGPNDRAAMTLLGPKIAAARAVGELARRAGRGGGTSLPGKVLMRLEPGAISELSARLPRGSVVISATNGKTTTAAMVASVLGRAGMPVVHNRAGANMAGGVASTLLAAARSGGRIDGELGLFEVDEFWLDRITPQLEPRGMLLGNLFRDQLDRYGELETIADRWAAVASSTSSAGRAGSCSTRTTR